MKTINNLIMKKKIFFVWILPLLSLTYIISHNLQVIPNLNGISPLIKHLYIFRKFVKFGFIRWTWKILNILGGYKYGAFISGHSGQQFNMKSHFGIFDPIVGEVQLYYDASSKDLIWMCELFQNIWFLYLS